MKTNVVEAVKFCFTSKALQQISLTVDETEKAVEKALERAIPLVLESLLLRVQRTGGPEALLDLAHEAYAADLLPHLPHLPSTAWYTKGASLMQGLAGEGYENLLSRIALVAGVRHKAAEELLRMATAAVLSVLGRYAAENELAPTEFVAWFHTQKAEVTMALFPDMSPRPVALNGSSEADHATAVATRPSALARQMGAVAPGAWAAVGDGATFTPPPPTAAAGFRWQWPLLLLSAVGLGYYFGHDRLAAIPGTAAAFADSPAPGGLVPGAAGAVPGTYDKSRDTYIYDTGQPIILTLADGTTQKVGLNSTENRLYTFLADPTLQVDSVNRTKGWINFDRVYFEASQATLTPESAQQLDNIAKVLKSFPKAIVKLGGYTDSTGNSLQNLLLSEERAKTAMLALAVQGISPDHLQAKGYGAKHFVVSNATPEGRALNRRISIRVLKK